MNRDKRKRKVSELKKTDREDSELASNGIYWLKPYLGGSKSARYHLKPLNGKQAPMPAYFLEPPRPTLLKMDLDEFLDHFKTK